MSNKTCFMFFVLFFFNNSLRTGPHHKRCRKICDEPRRGLPGVWHLCSTTPDPLASFRCTRPDTFPQEKKHSCRSTNGEALLHISSIIMAAVTTLFTRYTARRSAGRPHRTHTFIIIMAAGSFSTDWPTKTFHMIRISFIFVAA